VALLLGHCPVNGITAEYAPMGLIPNPMKTR
jgi:hypothetical protein